MPRPVKSSAQRPSAVGAILWLSAIGILGLLCVLTALNRLPFPLPGNIGCAHAQLFPQSCVLDLAARQQVEEGNDFLDEVERAARLTPAIAKMQAIAGVVAEKEGDFQAAGQFYVNSARLGWREPTGRVYSFLAAFQSGEIAAAMVHLDVLLALDEAYLSNPLVMDQVWSNPVARGEMAARIAEYPTYIGSFLRSFIQDQETFWDERIAVLARARELGFEFKQESAYVVWSIFAKNPVKAMDFWEAAAGPGLWADGGLAWSTDMDQDYAENRISPFAWHTMQGNGPTVQALQDEGGAGKLRIEPLPFSPAAPLLEIFVPMPSGTYLASWRVTGEESALYPTFVCAGGGNLTFKFTGRESDGSRKALVDIDSDCKMTGVRISKRSGAISRASELTGLTFGGADLLSVGKGR